MTLPPTIRAAAAALRARALSSEELTTAQLRAADRLDPLLGVYLRRCDAPALAAARAADRDFARGVDRGPLQGVPIGIKDLIRTREAPATGGSVVRLPGRRRLVDATVVARLRAGGAVIAGTVSTMEFGFGAPDPAKPFPLPRNPWDPARWPGGSSSGSGSGVAAGLFLGALGTDTGGSVRMPAACCGISGLRPSFGLVPRAGTLPLSESLDVVGPLARTADDLGLVLAAITTPDQGAAFAAAAPAPPLASLRLGVDAGEGTWRESAAPAVAECFDAAVATLRDAGATLVGVELPWLEPIRSATLVTMMAEAYAVHRPTLRTQWDSYGASARLAFAVGAGITAERYLAARRVRRVARRLGVELFDGLDAVLSPTLTGAAPQAAGLSNDDVMPLLLTTYWSALGNPVASVPMGFDPDGLPLGLQIAGRTGEDAAVLAIARAYERCTGWHEQRPGLSADADA